jgi:hypothetical protein
VTFSEILAENGRSHVIGTRFMKLAPFMHVSHFASPRVEVKHSQIVTFLCCDEADRPVVINIALLESLLISVSAILRIVCEQNFHSGIFKDVCL